MGLLRIMLPPKLQLLAVLVFGVAVLFLENQIQKLEESRGKLGERRRRRRGAAGGLGRNGPGQGAGGRREREGRVGSPARLPPPRCAAWPGPGWGGTTTPAAGYFSRVAPCVYMPEMIKDLIDTVWGLCRRGCQQQRRQPWPLSSFVCVLCETMRPRRDRCWKDKYFCSVSKWVS